MKPTRNQNGSSPLSDCRILVIEDNAYVREAFELTLNSSGLSTHAVSTAEEALKIVRQHTFDIIISDFRLPGMNGLEFFIEARAYTPISTKVLVSAYGFGDMVSDAKAAGVHHFFEKPFSIPSMMAQLMASTECPDAGPAKSL